MTRDPEVTAAALTDVAYFVEDDDGNLQTVFDGEVIHAELVDEPADVPGPKPPSAFDPVADSAVNRARKSLEGRAGNLSASTQWLPKVPELNPRRRTPDEATPIFDELDSRRGKKSWTKTMHGLRTALTRKQEQYHLEEGGHRDRVWEIEHASPLLNQLRQP